MSAPLGSNATALYNPESIRFRGVAVLTNTPPRVSQRAPGGEQAAAMLEPMISKAARHLGVDQVQIRKINAPVTGSQFGPPPPPAAAGAAAAAAAAPGARAGAPGGPPAVAQPQPAEQGRAIGKGSSGRGTSAGSAAGCGRRAARGTASGVLHELSPARSTRSRRSDLQVGRAQSRNGQRVGTKVTGVGVGLGTYTAGSIAMDGLLLVRDDGKVYVHSGIGNLGTGSVMDCSRIVAEELDMFRGNRSRPCGATRASTSRGARRRLAARRFMRTRARISRRRRISRRSCRKLPRSNAAAVRKATPWPMGVSGSLTFAQAAKPPLSTADGLPVTRCRPTSTT